MANAATRRTRRFRHRHIATGEQYSVRDFVNIAAEELGMKIRWQGEGINEKGYNVENDQCIVAVDPCDFRPTEVETLLVDTSKAREILGLTPKISFADLVKEMVIRDLKEAERDALVSKEGFTIPNRHE